MQGDTKGNVGDFLGIKPIAEAINTVTSATVDGVSEFLSRICLPAAEEFGLLLRDRVHAWRNANIAAIVASAERKLNEQPNPEMLRCPPRLACAILQQGSWIDDAVVQDLWAGLLSSSCSQSGDDDSNLIFVKRLSDMTKVQARILKDACERGRKSVSPNGLIQPVWLPPITLEELVQLTEETDIHRLDREVDDLRDSGLLINDSGFQSDSHSTTASISLTPLALNMFVRCQGSRLSPAEFFGFGPGPYDPAIPPSEAPMNSVSP